MQKKSRFYNVDYKKVTILPNLFLKPAVIFFVFTGLLLMGIFFSVPNEPKGSSVFLFSFFFFSVLPICLILLYTNEKIIFDGETACVYKEGFFGKKILMKFDEIHSISMISISLGTWYRLHSKQDPFSTRHRISPFSGSRNMLIDFKENVLTQIDAMVSPYAQNDDFLVLENPFGDSLKKNNPSKQEIDNQGVSTYKKYSKDISYLEMSQFTTRNFYRRCPQGYVWKQKLFELIFLSGLILLSVLAILTFIPSVRIYLPWAKEEIVPFLVIFFVSLIPYNLLRAITGRIGITSIVLNHKTKSVDIYYWGIFRRTQLLKDFIRFVVTEDYYNGIYTGSLLEMRFKKKDIFLFKTKNTQWLNQMSKETYALILTQFNQGS